MFASSCYRKWQPLSAINVCGRQILIVFIIPNYSLIKLRRKLTYKASFCVF